MIITSGPVKRAWPVGLATARHGKETLIRYPAQPGGRLVWSSLGWLDWLAGLAGMGVTSMCILDMSMCILSMRMCILSMDRVTLRPLRIPFFPESSLAWLDWLAGRLAPGGQADRWAGDWPWACGRLARAEGARQRAAAGDAGPLVGLGPGADQGGD